MAAASVVITVAAATTAASAGAVSEPRVISPGRVLGQGRGQGRIPDRQAQGRDRIPDRRGRGQDRIPDRLILLIHLILLIRLILQDRPILLMVVGGHTMVLVGAESRPERLSVSPWARSWGPCPAARNPWSSTIRPIIMTAATTTSLAIKALIQATAWSPIPINSRKIPNPGNQALRQRAWLLDTPHRRSDPHILRGVFWKEGNQAHTRNAAFITLKGRQLITFEI